MTNWHSIYNRLLFEKIPNPIPTANLIDQYNLNLEEVLHLIKKGCPFEYVIGEVDFYGAKISVNPNVLIPRSETEILVDYVSKEISKVNCKSKVLLDVCTGSGCIPISLKKKHPDLEVIAIDICDLALQLAKKNADLNQVKVDFLIGDLLEPIKERKIDFLISNPPYISETEYNLLDLSVRSFEPKMALTDNNDGLSFYRRLEKELPNILNKGAKIFFEIGFDQKNALFKIFSSPIWTKQQCLKDYAGHDRFFSLESDG